MPPRQVQRAAQAGTAGRHKLVVVAERRRIELHGQRATGALRKIADDVERAGGVAARPARRDSTVVGQRIASADVKRPRPRGFHPMRWKKPPGLLKVAPASTSIRPLCVSVPPI